MHIFEQSKIDASLGSMRHFLCHAIYINLSRWHTKKECASIRNGIASFRFVLHQIRLQCALNHFRPKPVSYVVFQIWLRLLLVLFCGVSTIKVPNTLPFALRPIYSASGLRNVYKMADMDAMSKTSSSGIPYKQIEKRTKANLVYAVPKRFKAHWVAVCQRCSVTDGISSLRIEANHQNAHLVCHQY